MGNLKFGNNAPLALYMGVSGATKAYYGTEVVFGGEPTPIDYSKEYLTFDILTGGTINWTEIGSQTLGAELSYSLNDGDWTALPTGSTINVSAGDKVRFKGNNPTYSNTFNKNAGCTFSGSTAFFNLYGNIMSLIYGDDFEGKTSISSECQFKNMFFATSVVNAENLVLVKGTIQKYSYAQMFLNCASLITAPQLPSTTLAENCYSNMFSGCSSLTVAPELPAANLAKYCYSYMFKGCTSLTTAPSLPAMTVIVTSYFHMFDGCTSLTEAPALPATTLEAGCYNNMFINCTSLTTAPTLPATTLAINCYNCMFQGCRSLTTAPELPAMTLVSNCYSKMFNGCTNLSSIKCLATDITASNCLSNWLDGVSSSGTFEGYSSAGYPSGASGIPSGWTFVEAT